MSTGILIRPCGSPELYNSEPHRIRTCNLLIKSQLYVAKLLNKTSVSELAELSNLSKAYISQVKTGKRPPSQKLLDALTEQMKPRNPRLDYITLFLQSRQARGVSPKTLEFYKERLHKFAFRVNYLNATPQHIERYLDSIPPNQNGFATRHASFRAMQAFYRWLNAEYGLNNPMTNLTAPILGKPILPSLTQEQVLMLIEKASCVRDKAIIALFAESGLRLSELANLRTGDIDWQNRTIKTLGKGNNEDADTFSLILNKFK